MATDAAGLRLTVAQWQTICDHLTQCLPEEACGLVGGVGGVAQTVYPIENIAHSPTYYEMHAAQQIEAMMAIEAHGDILAIFHSHPRGPLAPSETDIRESYYPDVTYLICQPTPTPQWAGKAFRIRDGQAREVPFEISP